MLSTKKLIVFGLLLSVLFAFKQADDYFEISKNLEIFSAVYKTVNSDYVEEVNPGELMKKGIDAMLASLDPYTNFYTESQAEDAMIQRSGEYGGIGCNSKKIGDYVVITNIRIGLPADKGGLMIGDKIIEINGKGFKGSNDNEVSEAIKGSPNTKFTIIVDRGGKLVTLAITREEIKIPNVSFYGMINSEVGYIRLDHFMAGAASEVRDALVKLKAEGMKKLIFDLRENGGGLLHEAVNIVNIFVDIDQLVVTSQGRSNEAFTKYKTLDIPADKQIPLVVLVNGRSASASEIVCGALQDFDRAVIIGRNTFGKGLVQNVKPLIHRSQMKVTIAKYYIPSGRCIQLLDYGHKNPDGTASIVPDSLRKRFKTKNGRNVVDGGGVRPDIIVNLDSDPEILENLVKSNILFDFATNYRLKHESIGEISSFQIDDATFEEFVNFTKDQNFTHMSSSEKAFKNLKENLEKEKITSLDNGLNQIEIGLKESRNSEIKRNKDLIKKALREEIARRYYYENAKFLLSYRYDPDLLKALETFMDLNAFNTILGKI
ncbi:MAG: S41 family peptidase [Bacteroidia bacterium]|nr:S41 family peptidase [Bacteroidia bacterium]